MNPMNRSLLSRTALVVAALLALAPARAFSKSCACDIFAFQIKVGDATYDVYSNRCDIAGPTCGETFDIEVRPYLLCVGFQDKSEKVLVDDVWTTNVVNEGCSPVPEDYQCSFSVQCDHLVADKSSETIPKTLFIHICYDSGAEPGTVLSGLSSLHWSVALGFTASGRSSGRLRLDSGVLSSALLSPRALRLENLGVQDIVTRAPYDATAIRQLKCPECYVDITLNAGSGYSLSFYKPSQVDGLSDEIYCREEPDRVWRLVPESLRDRIAAAAPGTHFYTNRVYRFVSGAVPFVSYSIEDPDGSVGDPTRIRITRTRPDLAPSYEEYSCVDGKWARSENGLRTTLFEESTANGTVTKTWTVLDPDGATNSVKRTTSILLGGWSYPVETVEGIGGAVRVTRQTFYDDLADGGRYAKLKSRVGSDGDWTEIVRNAEGREIERRTGWLSGGTNAPCRRVVYSYAPVFSGTNTPAGLPPDSPSDNRTTPRIETVYVGDSPVEKTLRAIHKDTMGYIRVETVRLLDPTVADNFAAWTDPANPHSLAIYMPENYGMPCSKLPWLVVNPDGTATSYDYISGDYVPGADGTPGVFTQVRGGPYFRTIATHGTAESFGIDSMGCSTNYVGVPLRTTRDVKLELRTGKREVLRMTEVCNAAGAYETVSWTTTTLDDLGHVVATRSSNGSRTENEWLGDRLVASTGADGIRTTYAYDGLGRRVSSSHVDPLTETEVVSSTTYDAAGHVLASTTTAGGLSQSTQRRYDSAGRLVWSRGPDGIETTTSYGTTNGLHFVATTRGADGLFTTSATYSYADGQTAYVERNGKRAETYEYGYADGLRWTIAYEGPKGTNSPVWTASVSDALDRTISELRPGFGGSILETSYAYNAAGQLLSSEEYTLSDEATPRTPRTPREILAQSMASQGSLRSLRENQTPSMASQGSLRARTLNLYDSLGALRVSALDVDYSGTIDFAGPDIVSSNETAFAFHDSAWWRESSRYSFPDTGSAEPLRVSTTRTRLSGLGVSETTKLGAAILASETRAVDTLGNASSQKSYRNRANHVSFNFSTSAASALSAWNLSIGGHSVSNRTVTGILSSRAYDALGRVIAQTDGRGNTTTLVYDTAGRLASTTDATGATTAYGYDALGRRTSVTNAFGLVTTTSYDLDGNVVSQRGAQYPVDYAYDGYGRMAAMSTYRSEDLSHADVTTWLYDEATGLMTNKVYADGKGPTYDYTPEGRLSRRTWARGVTTDYAYDGQGRLISKNYSDSTPDVSLAYDRLGHTLSAICAGVSTNLYAYNRLGHLTNEVQNGTTIARSYDALGRATGYAIGEGVAVGSAVSYSYDTLGRFASVVSGTNTFSYSYLPDDDLVSGMTVNTGHTWERIYELDRDLIATVHNRYGNRTISRFDYTNDEIGRRIARVDSGEAFSETAFERYSYNDRSEVIGSQRFYGSNISDLSRPVTGRTFGYGYDPIGNRVSSFEDVGGERLTTTYTANELNQYTAIQNGGSVPLRGDAKRDAVVTVNGDRAERDSGVADFAPWSHSLPSDDATAHYQNADVLAVAQNATGEDIEQRESGSVFVPAEETLLAYDDDGNMTFDGRFCYSWNGENRMIRAEEAVAPTNRASTVITYAYDEQGRMVSKNIAGTNTVARSLLWDGYNIVRETDNGVAAYNVWGLDLDGTLQGCGGVGGLLAVAKTNGLHVAFYDANGNVSEYMSAAGAVSAHYEYSPFGEPLVSLGESFAHQFSTKPRNEILNLNEYQLRSATLGIGCWLSRDPGEEEAAPNLFGFCNNNPVFTFDAFGLYQFITEDQESKGIALILSESSSQVSSHSVPAAYTTEKFRVDPNYAMPTIECSDCCCFVKEPQRYIHSVKVYLPLEGSAAARKNVNRKISEIAFVTSSFVRFASAHEQKHAAIIKHFGTYFNKFETWQLTQSVSVGTASDPIRFLQTHISNQFRKIKEKYFSESKAKHNELDSIEAYGTITANTKILADGWREVSKEFVGHGNWAIQLPPLDDALGLDNFSCKTKETTEP